MDRSIVKQRKSWLTKIIQNLHLVIMSRDLNVVCSIIGDFPFPIFYVFWFVRFGLFFFLTYLKAKQLPDITSRVEATKLEKRRLNLSLRACTMTEKLDRCNDRKGH